MWCCWPWSGKWELEVEVGVEVGVGGDLKLCSSDHRNLDTIDGKTLGTKLWRCRLRLRLQ